MANSNMRFEKILDTLPTTLTPNTTYFLKNTLSGRLTQYLSDSLGQAVVQVSGKVPSYNDLTDKPTIASSASDLGLGNVDNTSDADKPISAVTQAALDDKASKIELTNGLVLKADSTVVTAGLALKADVTALTSGLALKLDTSKVGIASGACDLDANQKVPLSRLPDSILGSLSYQGARDMATALPAADVTNKGWYYIASNVTPINGYTKGDWAVSNGITWDRIDNTSAVQSVAGRTGAVTLTTADLTDFATAITSPLDLKAPLASPTFTGTVTIPTPTTGDNSTSAASTEFVVTAISTKAPLASPAFTGTPTAPTAVAGTRTTQLATTEFVLANALTTASPALTGTPTAPTAAAGTKTTQLATTEFVATGFATLSVPLTTKTTAYVLVATDKSTRISTTTGITINKDLFAAGDSVIICNANTTATNITITIGTGLTCYLDGNIAAKTSLVLAARGTAAFMFDSGTIVNALGKSLS